MCVVSLKSMTIALKAKKALNEAFIGCEIIKLEPHMTKKGCAYGVQFDCLNFNNVESILKHNKVKYTEIFRL